MALSRISSIPLFLLTVCLPGAWAFTEPLATRVGTAEVQVSDAQGRRLFYLDPAHLEALGQTGGRIVGGPPQVVSDSENLKGLRFDGNTWIVFQEASHLDVPQLTIEICFKGQFSAPARYNPCLIAQRESGDHRQTRWSVHIMGDYSAIALWNGKSVAVFRSPAGALKPEVWYHLVIVTQKSGTTVYLDGVPCITDSPSWTINIQEKGRPLTLAASQPSGHEAFLGALANVVIYDTAWTAEQVAARTDELGFRDERLALAQQYQEILKRQAEEQARLADLREKRRMELMNDPALVTRGQPTVYEAERLECIDIPIGGIGVGAIHMNGRAERHAWQIFGSVAYRQIPESFFAIGVSTPTRSIVRTLQTTSVAGIPPMQRLRLEAPYPFAVYRFQDEEVSCHVTLTAFNPLIPLHARDSAIPCAVYRIGIHNPMNEPVTAAILGTQLNVVGYQADKPIDERRYERFGKNVNSVLRTDKGTWLCMTKQDAPDAGEMVLMVDSPRAKVLANWEDSESLTGLLRAPSQIESLQEVTTATSREGETVNGAVFSCVDIPPGETREVTYVLVWYLPGQPAGTGAWGCKGRRYEAWWKNAQEVAAELEQRLPELEAASRMYVDSLYESNLPYWLIDRIASQVAILRSPTVFWCREGYFGGWEGCNVNEGCCHGNCNHVWHYAQAHARLFPEIAKQMREQEFTYQKPDGAIPHRQPDSFPAFDGQCGAVLNSYREHLMSSDRSWLDSHWPAIRRAMDYVVQRWDPDQDGLLSGPQWNTLDGELGGNSSWLGSLYLAALTAAEKMARLEGDITSAEKYQRIARLGAAKQDELLFNGRYYIQIPDPTPHEDYGEGCAIDQVLGQWWAHQLDLGWVYPPEHVTSALRTLFALNFRGRMEGLPQLPRKFVADEDGGMQMFVWPEGAKKPSQIIKYASEVMTGFEYAAAAAMIQAGLLKEGLTVCRAIALRYDGRKRVFPGAGNFNNWGYSGNPFGDDECGKFYARAMSVWSILLACQGFIYDGPDQRIGFIPVWQPEDHVSLFTAAEGWGVYRQWRGDGEQNHSLSVRFGQLAVKTFEGATPAGTTPKTVQCVLEKREIPCVLRCDEGRFSCVFEEPVVVHQAQSLDIRIAW
ncbi:MAG TPA: GH116 family glycosyl hydrolase [Thermogutta sp.]|nr:GH116 family glycosyl hydrolase [Thermogutta sp.]